MKIYPAAAPFITLAFTFAVTSPVSARIGDSPGVCASRYGDIIETSADGLFVQFQKDGVRVSCSFTGGACSAISYSLCPTGYVERAEPGKEARFTKDQVNRLLNINRGTAAWVQESKGESGQEQDGAYKTNDGKLQALVNFVAVNVETITAYQAKLALVEVAAVDKTIATFDSGAGGAPAPVIRNIPEVPKTVDPLEKSLKQMEKSNQELKEGMEEQKRESAKAIAALDMISKRIQKREEMKNMLIRYKALEADLAAAKTPEDSRAIAAKVAALTDEMNRSVVDYGALDSEHMKQNPNQ